MLLYTDIVSGDEMFSDAFPMKLVNNIVYEVDCAMVTFKEGEVDIGANPSAEEGAEALEDGAQTVNNIIHTFRLKPTSFEKGAYGKYLKGYMKAIKEKLQSNGASEEELAAFQTNAGNFAKTVLQNFKDYEFYTGAEMDVDGMVALLNYREDGITPYFTFWKHGLKEVKL